MYLLLSCSHTGLTACALSPLAGCQHWCVVPSVVTFKKADPDLSIICRLKWRKRGGQEGMHVVVFSDDCVSICQLHVKTVVLSR